MALAAGVAYSTQLATQGLQLAAEGAAETADGVAEAVDNLIQSVRTPAAAASETVKTSLNVHMYD